MAGVTVDRYRLYNNSCSVIPNFILPHTLFQLAVYKSLNALRFILDRISIQWPRYADV
jgi:hypothetical protein